MNVTELTPMNIYSSNQYRPLTPQSLPFDAYPPQALSKSNNASVQQLMSSSNNGLMTTPPPPKAQPSLKFSTNSVAKTTSSTLVNLLHQKRHATVVDQALPNNSTTKEKQATPVKQTRKRTQKKSTPKRLMPLEEEIQVNLIRNSISIYDLDLFIFIPLASTKSNTDDVKISINM